MGPIFKIWKTDFQKSRMELETVGGTFFFAPAIQSLLSVRKYKPDGRRDMRDARMQNAADAKAFGAVTAKTIRVSERWKGSGTKSGECVSIFPDGTRIPFVRTRNTENRKPRTVSITRAAQTRALIQSITLDHDYNNG